MHFNPSLLTLALFMTLSNAAKCTSSNAIPVEQLVASGQFGDLDLAKQAQGLIGAATRRKRAIDVVSCTGTEICYSLTDVPFCCDILTGYFHSSSTEGNIYTGDYTLNDGQEGNLFRGPYPTPTSAATSKTAEDVSTTVSRSVTFLGSATVSRTADATGVSGTGSKVAESTSVATETEAATSSAGGSGSGSGSVSSAPSSASTPGAGVKLSKPNGTVLAFLLGLLFL